MDSSLKSKLYVIGLVLILLSFLGCVVSYYLIPFGLPVFAVGALLVALSNRQFWVKLTTALVPLVLWLPSTMIFLSWYGRTTPQTYLIPSDYEGSFRVVYGEPCGIEPAIEGGRRVLVIPANGQLIVKPEHEGGIIDHEYYFVDSHGKRTRINTILEYRQRIESMPGVMFSGSGSMGGVMPNGSSSTEAPTAIDFADLYVFNKDSVDRSDYKANEAFDDSTRALVERCRDGH